MKSLEIKLSKPSYYGPAQKGDLAYVLTQGLTSNEGMLVRKTESGFEISPFTVTKDVTAQAEKKAQADKKKADAAEKAAVAKEEKEKAEADQAEAAKLAEEAEKLRLKEPEKNAT